MAMKLSVTGACGPRHPSCVRQGKGPKAGFSDRRPRQSRTTAAAAAAAAARRIYSDRHDIALAPSVVPDLSTGLSLTITKYLQKVR